MEEGMSNKKEIEKILLGFHLKGEIIEKKRGTYGVVFIVDNGEGHYPRYVAYKTIETSEIFSQDELKNFVREAKQWFKVKGHALILTPLYITYFKNLPLICMPFCDFDLETYLGRNERLDLVATLVFTAQILKALIFAKDRGINDHQDLKPGNILLEDLGKKFKDIQSLSHGLHESIKFKVRLADFGLANAWRELNRPQGSHPYMAPEQYTPGEYGIFSPDIFAVGVMMAEMLTGRHPCGKKTKRVWKDWNRTKWEQWAKYGERTTPIGSDEMLQNVEALIQKMLLPNPKSRPSKEAALEKVMGFLTEAHERTAEQLKLWFEYYDTLAQHGEERNRLQNLIEISHLPGQMDFVIDELSDEMAGLEKSLDNPHKLVSFSEVGYGLSGILLERQRVGDKIKVQELAERILSEVIKMRKEIKTFHKYPELKFRDISLIGPLGVRDLEAYSELLGYGWKLLESTNGREGVEKYFEDKDNYTRSTYLYGIASRLRYDGNVKESIEILNRCIELNPDEPLFHYMKALWKDGLLLILSVEKEVAAEDISALKKSILEDVSKAMELGQGWEEPKKLYEEIVKRERQW